MNVYAIYRMYYGEDFIEESIESIIDHVDKVFIFAPKNSFGNIHKGRVDNSLRIVKAMPLRQKSPNKIVIIENSQYDHTPRNQFTNLYNTYIYNIYPAPDVVMCIEPDMVWRAKEIHDFYTDFSVLGVGSMNSDQVEFWHNDSWILPPRDRFACILHRLYDDKMAQTGLSGNIGSKMNRSRAKVDNYGFCLSPENMKMKFDLGLAYSKFIGDSVPNPDWYEYKWLKWHPDYNNENLEISKGYEHHIPYVGRSNLERNIHLIDHKWNPSIFTQAQEQSSGDIRTK